METKLGRKQNGQMKEMIKRKSLVSIFDRVEDEREIPMQWCEIISTHQKRQKEVKWKPDGTYN